MTASRVINLYDLMDSAYDAPEIKAKSLALGHVPIIDPHPRNVPGGKKAIAAEARGRRTSDGRIPWRGRAPAHRVPKDSGEAQPKTHESLANHVRERTTT